MYREKTEQAQYKGERINSLSHMVGALLALAGLILLVIPAALKGDPWKIVSFTVYGITLVILYTFSTLYHGFRGKARLIFQKLDHVAIYLLIAGSYTPFALVSLRGVWGWTLFGIVWTLAAAGLIQEILLKKRNQIVSVSLYVLMGWLALIAIRPLSQALPTPGLLWLLTGGLFYTVGIVFYALGHKLKYGHTTFHFFVLSGSISHYIAVFFYVA
jgi:hemolysin III